MNEPWNIKKDDERTADTLPTFIIFCEDEVSEPIYFKFFETDKIKVNPIKKQKSNIANVLNAIEHCKEGNLIEKSDDGLKLCDSNTIVWCVFDRDSIEQGVQESSNNTSFDVAIYTAQNCGINVAWSNDSFELWILMHFEEIDANDKNYQKRETYYSQLTKIFKNHKEPNEYLKKALSHDSFSYKKDLKSERNFRNIVRAEIVTKTNLAIERAHKLETNFNNLELYDHEKSPCTHVHYLVQQLLNYGGKKI